MVIKKCMKYKTGVVLFVGVSESELSIKLCLDHDHRDGYARGLICRKCNAVLGFMERDSKKGFRDPLPILKNVTDYLLRDRIK